MRLIYEPLYPKDGALYATAMKEAAEEFNAWELTRTRLGGGIQICTTKQVAEEFGEELEG